MSSTIRSSASASSVSVVGEGVPHRRALLEQIEVGERLPVMLLVERPVMPVDRLLHERDTAAEDGAGDEHVRPPGSPRRALRSARQIACGSWPSSSWALQPNASKRAASGVRSMTSLV